MSPRPSRHAPSPPARRHRFRVLAVASLALAAVAAPLSAQQSMGRVEGRVTESGSAEPIAGASVVVVGTRLGTVTDAEGRYTLLNIPAGAHELTARRIGMQARTQSATVVAGQTLRVDFELSQAAISLDEVVVTGTAIATRAKEVGTSTEVLSSEIFENVPVQNPSEVLAGRMPSVTVMQNSGQPGAGMTVKVRGTNTVTQNTEPLIYIDGVRIHNEPVRAGWGGRQSTSPLQDIPAGDIERIEVIKGAAATTLYGTEASGGVIQVFTKRGLAGEPQWQAEVGAGVSQMGEWGGGSDPSELFTRCGDLDLMYGLDVTDAYGPDGRADRVYFVDPTCPSDGDWAETGYTQQVGLSVRGGAERITYYVSGNYGDVTGVLPTQGSKDGGFRANLGFSASDELQFHVNSAYTRRNTRWVGDGNNSEGFLLNVGRGYRGYFVGGKDEQCDAVPDVTPGGEGMVCVANGNLFEDEFYTRTDHFITGLSVNYAPTDQFSNRFAVGWDFTQNYNETTLPFGYQTTPLGYFWDENTHHTKLSLDYTGSFRNNFGTDIVSTLSWGGQLFRDRNRWTEIDVSDFSGPGRPSLLSGAIRDIYGDNIVAETNAGVFLQEQFGWRDRLFLTGGIRIDGNSAFGDDFGLQTYPKISAAYVLSDYAFWPVQYWDTFKLRAALGESGKAPGAFDKLRTYTPVSGDDNQPGVVLSEVGNAKLGPERTREIEAGFDAGFFDSRLGFEFTAYSAETSESLICVTQVPSTGVDNCRMENVGTIQNEGLEFRLTGAILRMENLEWQGRLNASFNRSEALDLDGDPNKITSLETGLNSEVREGEAFPVYYGDRIDNPGAFADPVTTRDQYIGPVYPTRLWGLGTTVTFFERFSFDALAEYQGGHYLPNYTAYQNARRGVFHPCYDIQQKIIARDDLGQANALDGVTALQRAQCSIDDYDSDFWIEKADFVKLRTVSLTYDIPSEFVRFASDASITLAGRNLYTWTDYTGTDPEVQDVADQVGDEVGSEDLGRRDYYQLPAPRTFLLSFRVGF